MKKVLTSITISVAAMSFAACSDTKSEKAKADHQPAAEENILNLGEASQAAMVAPGSDNSEISTLKDNYGIVVETRTFKGDDKLDHVVVKTLGDGTKFGFAVTKAGDKLPLADNHVAVALTLSGRDLSRSLGLGEESSITTTVSSEPIPPAPAPVLTSVQPPPASVVEPQPDAEALRRRAEETKRAEEERVRRMQREVSGVPFKN